MISGPPHSAYPTLPAAEDGGAGALSARVAFLTDLGRKRKNNEDFCTVYPLDSSPLFSLAREHSFGLASPGLLMAVADGMGGHFGGEIASRLGVESLTREFFQYVRNPGSVPIDPQAVLRQAVEASHKAVYAQSQTNDGIITMGTTLTVVWLMREYATIAQVGDSRAYLFRDGDLILLTQDQTIGNLLRSRGQDLENITGEVKEMLTQAVGAQPDIEVITGSVRLQPGDWLLLCSDGLHKLVPPEDLAACLEARGDLAVKTLRLISRANENGGLDNITTILAEIHAA